jgi:hypothetical protein
MAFITILASALPCVYSRRKKAINKKQTKKMNKLWTREKKAHRWVIQLPFVVHVFHCVIMWNYYQRLCYQVASCIMTKLSWHPPKKITSQDFLLVRINKHETKKREEKIKVHLHARWIFLRRKTTFSFRPFTSLISDMCLYELYGPNRNRHGHWNPQIIYPILKYDDRKGEETKPTRYTMRDRYLATFQISQKFT